MVPRKEGSLLHGKKGHGKADSIADSLSGYMVDKEQPKNPKTLTAEKEKPLKGMGLTGIDLVIDSKNLYILNGLI